MLCRAAQAKFTRQGQTRLTFTNASQESDDLCGTQMLSFKDGAAVQGINALTLFATIDAEATPFCLSKGTCLFDTGLTVWALQTARVKVFQHPGGADVLIE